MPLRKSPQLTPELLAAKQANARKSTGPRTPAGKQNSKFNGVKHGAYAASENHYQVMRALGEDPQEFEFLKQQLMLSYGPTDPLWQHQVEDLAKLYWRRQRLERAQEGMMRRALLAAAECQRRRREEMAGVTFDASQPDILELPLLESADPGVRLRKLLSYLVVIREQARQRSFGPRQCAVLENGYQGSVGWRQARLLKLLGLFSESEPTALPGEPQYQELLGLLDQEIARVQEEFEYAEKVNEEKAALERDACLAPVGEDWRTLVRLEGALDRSIDRKVKILLALREQYRDDPDLSAAPEDQTDETFNQKEETLTESINKMLGIHLPSPSAAAGSGSGEFTSPDGGSAR